jgi:hypothetical protein
VVFGSSTKLKLSFIVNLIIIFLFRINKLEAGGVFYSKFYPFVAHVYFF